MKFLTFSRATASMALAMVVVSCSNNEDLDSNQHPKQVQVRIMNDVVSKAAQTPGSGEKVAIFNNQLQVGGLMDSNPTGGLNTITINASGEGMATIPANSNGINVIANWDGETIDGLLRTDQVYTRQGGANTAAVRLQGQTNTLTGNDQTGYTAAVTINPDMSRFEISGTFTPVDPNTNPTHALKGYNIIGIYMNNLYATRTATTLTNNNNDWSIYNAGGTWAPLAEMATGNANLNGGPGTNMVYGFNIFPQTTQMGADLYKNSPHMIFQLSDGTTTKWLNVKSFLVSNIPILNFSAGKIYQITLNEIQDIIDNDPSGSKVTPQPDPMDKSVSLTVTVAAWTGQPVNPGV